MTEALAFNVVNVVTKWRALRLNPDDASVFRSRGIAKSVLDRDEEAIADLDEALRLNPEDAFAHRWRGIAKSALDRREEAISDFDEALRLNPEDASAYRRGIAKSVLDRDEEAIRILTKRLNPEDAFAPLRGIAKSALEALSSDGRSAPPGRPIDGAALRRAPCGERKLSPRSAPPDPGHGVFARVASRRPSICPCKSVATQDEGGALTSTPSRTGSEMAAHSSVLRPGGMGGSRTRTERAQGGHRASA